MKKIIVLLSILFLITGCRNKKEDQELILKELVSNNYIDSNYKEIDTQSYSGYHPESCLNYTIYIYEDSNSNLFGIEFSKYFGQNKYKVLIYSDVSIKNDDEIDYYEDGEAPEKCLDGEKYYTSNQRAAKEPKYSFSNSKSYVAVQSEDKSSYILEEN